MHNGSVREYALLMPLVRVRGTTTLDPGVRGFTEGITKVNEKEKIKSLGSLDWKIHIVHA